MYYMIRGKIGKPTWKPLQWFIVHIRCVDSSVIEEVRVSGGPTADSHDDQPQNPEEEIEEEN